MSKFNVGDKVRFIRETPYSRSVGKDIVKGDEGIVVSTGFYCDTVFPGNRKGAPMLESELELVTGSTLDSLAQEFKLLHVKRAQIQDREAALLKERQNLNDQIDKLGDKILEACRSVK